MKTLVQTALLVGLVVGLGLSEVKRESSRSSTKVEERTEATRLVRKALPSNTETLEKLVLAATETEVAAESDGESDDFQKLSNTNCQYHIDAYLLSFNFPDLSYTAEENMPPGHFRGQSAAGAQGEEEGQSQEAPKKAQLQQTKNLPQD